MRKRLRKGKHSKKRQLCSIEIIDTTHLMFKVVAFIFIQMAMAYFCTQMFSVLIKN